MTVLNRVREVAASQGHTTAYQMATKTGLCMQTAYTLWANPDQTPSLGTIAKICRAYQVEPGDLFQVVTQ